MKTLRAAVVGLGEMGSHHARALADLEGVRLVVVVEPRLAGHMSHGAPVVRSLEDIAERNVDVAVVAVPTVSHLSIGQRLAELGVHALIEKPLAHDQSACEALHEAFESRGLVGCVGHIERYNPALMAMRRRLQEGILGDVYQVVTRRQGPYPARIKDVGVVMDLATHDLDLASWVTGLPYESVSAHSTHRSGGIHEDMVAIVGKLRGGVVTSHLVNWLSPLKERVCVVTGSNGCLVADTLSGDLTFYKNGVEPIEWESVAAFRGVVQGDVIRYALPKREPLVVELEAFRDAVHGTRSDIVDLEAGSRAVQVAEAVLESVAGGGATVSVDDVPAVERRDAYAVPSIISQS